jgi:hypothetical protein
VSRDSRPGREVVRDYLPPFPFPFPPDEAEPARAGALLTFAADGADTFGGRVVWARVVGLTDDAGACLCTDGLDGADRITCGDEPVASRGGVTFDRITGGVARMVSRCVAAFDRMTVGAEREASRWGAVFDGSDRITGGFALVDRSTWPGRADCRGSEGPRGDTTSPPRTTGWRCCWSAGDFTKPPMPSRPTRSSRVPEPWILRPSSSRPRSGRRVPNVGVRVSPRWFSKPRRPSSLRPSPSKKSRSRGPRLVPFQRPGPRSLGRQSRPFRSQLTRPWMRRYRRSML